jgi:hypothetical protein
MLGVGVTEAFGVAPIGGWVGTGETETPGELLIIGVDGDGLAPTGLCKPGLRLGCSPAFRLVLGTVDPLLGAAFDGFPL